MTTEEKHGFTLSYKAFEHPNFLPVMRKVYGCETYPNFKSTYRVKKLCEAIETEIKLYMDERKDAKTEEEIKTLYDKAFPIKWDKLTGVEIMCIEKISPAELTALEFVADTSSLT